MTQCEIMSSCSTNFPFSLACNGHGLCQPFPSNNITQISNPQAVCQCMGGYSASGSGLDLFVDPGTVPCFIPRSYLTTANVCLFVTTALAFLRVLQIVFFWIVSCFEKRNTDLEYSFVNEVKCRTRLQVLFIRLFLGIAGMLLIIHKVTSYDIAPIGQDVISTCLYSCVWICGMSGVLLRLSQSVNAAIGVLDFSGLTSVLRHSQSILIMLGICSCIAFLIAPLTFAFPPELKNMSSTIVFSVEIAIFTVYVFMTWFFVHRNLLPLLTESLVFLESQAHERMRPKIDSLTKALTETRFFGKTNLIFFICVILTRIVLLIYPHLFFAIFWLEFTMSNMHIIVSWLNYKVDIQEYHFPAIVGPPALQNPRMLSKSNPRSRVHVVPVSVVCVSPAAVSTVRP